MLRHTIVRRRVLRKKSPIEVLYQRMARIGRGVGAGGEQLELLEKPKDFLESVLAAPMLSAWAARIAPRGCPGFILACLYFIHAAVDTSVKPPHAHCGDFARLSVFLEHDGPTNRARSEVNA